MKWLFSLLLMTSLAHAETSSLIPAFLEAVDIYESPAKNHLYVRPEVLAAVKVLKEKNIRPESLNRFKNLKSQVWKLREDDKYDAWIRENKNLKTNLDVPEISLHATRIDVVNATEYGGDSVYAYFFITDGVIPTGKVSSIYENVSSGEGFFFNATDRAVFPLIGITAKAPSNHLIVDYGVIESDGDDIKEMQEISSIIIDMAIAVYSAQNPAAGAVLVNLRKEIKAMADLLIKQNSDDRLITDSFGYTSQEIAELMSDKSYLDITKNHAKETTFSSWEYNVHFRLLR